MRSWKFKRNQFWACKAFHRISSHFSQWISHNCRTIVKFVQFYEYALALELYQLHKLSKYTNNRHVHWSMSLQIGRKQWTPKRILSVKLAKIDFSHWMAVFGWVIVADESRTYCKISEEIGIIWYHQPWSQAIPNWNRIMTYTSICIVVDFSCFSYSINY